MTLWSVSHSIVFYYPKVFRALYCHCVCNVYTSSTSQFSMATMLALLILRFGKYACGMTLIVLMFILSLTKIVSFRSYSGASTPLIRLTWLLPGIWSSHSFPGLAVSQKCLCLLRTCLCGCCVVMCLCCCWILSQGNQERICGTRPNNTSITGQPG
jgi:hypothetical protein